jgi:DNA-binding transcriptional LysR family regulator
MKEVDLNLLPMLQALLELRSVSKAAERSHLSQPSMSGALAKLRRHFGDELLVRAGRGYELTPFAQSLAKRVDRTLIDVQETMQLRTEFDPSSSDRTFVIAASDYATTTLIRPLRRLMAETAAKVSVRFVQSSPIKSGPDEFSSIDLLVGPMGYDFGGDYRQLFRDDFVVVMDSSNPLLSRPKLTVEDIAAAPLAMGEFGPGVTTPPARFFRERGLNPTIVAEVSGWQSVPMLASGTDLVALAPRRLATRMHPDPSITVVEFAPHLEVAVVESMYWNPLQATDPANSWLRTVLQQVSRELNTSLEARVHHVQIGTDSP